MNIYWLVCRHSSSCTTDRKNAVKSDILAFCRNGAKPGSFQARDNLANFIQWVRNHLGVNDVLLFESDDLVLMKNEKNVILCLLEVRLLRRFYAKFSRLRLC